jgi:hypothetical protein
MLHNIIVFRICTVDIGLQKGHINFAQWACGFGIMIRLGRPKKVCPSCLVRTNGGRKGQMRTVMYIL